MKTQLLLPNLIFFKQGHPIVSKKSTIDLHEEEEDEEPMKRDARRT